MKILPKFLAVLLLIPLLSIICTGCGPSKVTISTLVVSPEKAAADQNVTISANFLSSEEKDVNYKATLQINEEIIESREILISPGETKAISFNYSTSELGSYTADINGQTAVFEVVAMAVFETGELVLNPDVIVTREEFEVSVELSNTGGLTGSYKALLLIDGEEISGEEFELEAGSSRTVTMTSSIDSSGSHTIELCGVSEETAVLKAAEFEATSVSVSPTSIYAGQSASVKATIKNVGEVEGTLPVDLKVNGSKTSSKTLTLEPGASSDVSFTVKRDTSGRASISILGKSTTLTVGELEEYHNNIFFYTISYPSDYEILDEDPTSVLIEDHDIGGIAVLVDKVPRSMTPADYLEETVQGKQAEQPDWTLTSQIEVVEDGNVIGYTYDYSHTLDGVKWKGKGIVIKKGGYGYYAVFTTKESDWNEYLTLATMCVDSFATPNVFNDSYSNPETGLTLTLPGDWNAIETGDKDAPLSVSSPYDEPTAVGTLNFEAVPSDMTAQDYAELLLSQLESYGFGELKKASFSFTNGTTGYECSATATSAGRVMKLRIICVLSGTKMYSFLFSGEKTDIDAQASDITQLVRSLEITTPEIAGYSRNETLFLYENEIPTLDPATCEVSPDTYIGAIFSGLVKIDKNLEPVADLAESWTVSEDGKTYTFKLRANAKFHDGRQVTAADVKYSWERACDPDTDSPKASSFLNDIVGADDMLAGRASSISGLRVVNDTTLEVTIDSPKQYFLAKLAQPVAYIVDENNVNQGTSWYENPNGTGPFKLKEWEEDDILVLERNDDFYAIPAKIKYVYFKLFAGYPMTLYESGEIDVTSVSYSNVERVLDTSNPLNAELLEVDEIVIGYLGMNVDKPPFDDPKVRRAFALAINTETIIDVALKGRAERAAGYIPPGIPGHNSSLQPLSYDVDAAKQLITESSYGSVDNLPTITFHVPYGISSLDEAIIGMLQQNLGVTINVEVISTVEEYLDKMTDRELHMYTSGWIADFIDPQNYLEILFKSDSKENGMAYSNSEVDAALIAAGIESNESSRLQQYRDIEQMILADMPAIPLYTSTKHYVLVKPYVKGYTLHPIGINIWTEIYLDL